MSTTRVTANVGQHHIPLSSIVVKEGFNPRGPVVQDAELQALAATIRDGGVLSLAAVLNHSRTETPVLAQVAA